MLILKNISKKYQKKKYNNEVLKNLNLTFNINEFVSIIGESGSGKTTLLNIIGGIDEYDDGDLIINNKSTKKYKSHDWDLYRNNYIGFIFQNYYLINHLSILKNVEMSLILNGTSKKKRKILAIKALKRVGLKKVIYKKPNELSGGQMQRVAIARAIVNNPKIILADEPTGALDEKNSIQIMNLIKKISKNRLVIMVTHNKYLAKKYSNRIIKLCTNNKIIDTGKKIMKRKKNKIFIKDTYMSYYDAINISINNILSKKGRFILMSLALSISIIGVSLILSISYGFKNIIKNFEGRSISSFPITIFENVEENKKDNNVKIEKDKLSLLDTKNIHINQINNNYIDFINNYVSKYTKNISYQRNFTFNFVYEDSNSYNLIDNNSINFESIDKSYLKKNYNLIGGRVPNNKYEIAIIVNEKKQISKEILKFLNISFDNKNISFDEILNKEIKYIFNDYLYKKISNDMYLKKNIDSNLYNNKNNLKLKIVGILNKKKDKKLRLISNNIEDDEVTKIVYQEELIRDIVEKNSHSKIALSQLNSNYLVTMKDITKDEYKITDEQALAMVGASFLPNKILLYPQNRVSKKFILEKLNLYNKKQEEKNKIIYSDYGKKVIKSLNETINSIVIVLMFFTIISLFISMLLISIIMYLSVLDRKCEIGILRSLGARKKDIIRIFNSESIIIGLLSSIIAIFITKIIIIYLNKILYDMMGLANVAVLTINNSAIIISISILVTLLSNFIPSLMASRKKIVKSLKNN